MKTITREYNWDTKMENVSEIEVDGVTYVPMTGNRVDPKLAALRASLPNWSAELSRPAYWVTFVRADSRFVSAMGRAR